MAVRNHRWTVLAGAAALASVSIGAAPPASNALTATGKTIALAKADLDACIARSCAVPEDIAATIALADSQFAAGEWTEAARTLSQARDRNRKFAGTHPVEVGDLLRVYGHIAWLRGNPGAYRMAALDKVDALKEGLGDKHPRVMMARIEVADMMSYGGPPYNTAENKYQEAIAQAKADGQPGIEGLALFRRAMMFSWATGHDRGSFEKRAYDYADALIASPVPEHAVYADAAKVLKGVVGTMYRNKDAAQGLIAALRAQPRVTFDLLSYEPIERSNYMTKQGPKTQGQTMDLAYFVSPDGRVRGHAMVLQYEQEDNRKWGLAIAASIESRRYAPLGLDAAHPGVMRIERYTIHGGDDAPIRIEMRALTGNGEAIEVPTKVVKFNK